MLTNPGFQFSARDGDGFCFGSPLKKVQWILTIIITQVQIMLYPDENMKDFTSALDSTTYPGQDFKLRHMQYVFDNFLLVSKNVLASRVGMYNDSEEALAGVVVEAVKNFAEAWFPATGPPIPAVEQCVRLNKSFLSHTQ